MLYAVGAGMIESHLRCPKFPSIDKWGNYPGKRKAFQPSAETNKKRDTTDLDRRGGPNALA